MLKSKGIGDSDWKELYMANAPWVRIANSVRQFVVLIETPSGRGTGFVVPPLPGSNHQTVITAYHVVDHALAWREPIKITHFPTKKQAFLNVNSRLITPNQARDQVIIQFSADALPLPANTIEMLPANSRVNDGVEAGWLGYPAVAPNNLCFFTGCISTWLANDEAYLVDGVAINGVSGGPAFYENEKGEIVIVGIVTEYRPNVATGKLLPGVSLIRSISPLMAFYAQLRETVKSMPVEDAKVQDMPEDKNADGLPTNLM